jgi:hypothetical protein
MKAGWSLRPQDSSDEDSPSPLMQGKGVFTGTKKS